MALCLHSLPLSLTHTHIYQLLQQVAEAFGKKVSREQGGEAPAEGEEAEASVLTEGKSVVWSVCA